MKNDESKKQINLFSQKKNSKHLFSEKMQKDENEYILLLNNKNNKIENYMSFMKKIKFGKNNIFNKKKKV